MVRIGELSSKYGPIITLIKTNFIKSVGVKMSRTSEIKIIVELDDKKMPTKIDWEATDAGFKGQKAAKTLMLSLWDEQDNVTYGIDLWIKEMTVEEMQIHFHQIIIKMAGTFERATNDKDAAVMIRNFCNEFAKKFNLKNDKINE